MVLWTLLALIVAGALAGTAAAAAGDGGGSMAVSPGSVTAGSQSNALTFTYTAPTGGGLTGQTTIDVPAGWTVGSVGTPTGSCTSLSASISGSTVTVNMTCGNKATYALTLSGVTAPTAAGSATFTTKTRASGGTLTAIGTSPSVTVAPAAASKLVVTTAAQSTLVGTTTGTITVQQQDAFGNAVNAGTGGLTLALSSSSSGGTFRNLADTAAIASVVIASGTSTASFRYRDSAAGTPTITAAETPSAGLTDAAQQVTVNAVAAKLAFTSAPQTVTAGATTGTMTVQLQDAAGNPVAAGTAGLTLALSTTSATGEFRSLADAVITSVAIAAGSSTASFKYRDTTTGTPTITAAETPSAGLADATQTATVTPPAKQDQTIAFGPPANATYGDPAVQLAATASSGLAVTYTVTGPCSVSGSTVSLTGTGTCTVTAHQAGNAAYNAAPDVTQSFQIAKAVLTVTPNPQTRLYGDANPVFTATISGLKNGETAAGVVAGSPACTSAATPTSPAGAYAIACTAGTLQAANYTFDTSATGTLTVAKATLTVRPNDQSRAYGDPNPAFTAAITGLRNGESLGAAVSGAPACGSAATAASPVGTYGISCAVGTLQAANYTFDVSATGTLTVTPAVLAVTPRDAMRAYGDANPTFTATISGLKNGETAADVVSGAPVCMSAATATSPVGTYAIGCAVGTLHAANYTFDTSPAGMLTITPAVLTVTPKDASRAYGDPNPAIDFTIAGLKNGEKLADVASGAPVCGSAATPASPVGGYAITCALGDLQAANYTFDTSATATLSVTPAVLTVTPADASRAYGDPNPAFQSAISGFKNGEKAADVVTGAPACASTATPASPVGTYPIACTAGDLQAANYRFDTSATATLTVTAAVLSVTPKDASRAYGDPNPAIDFTIAGLRNGDKLADVVSGAPACASAATATSPVGRYGIACQAGTLKAANYGFDTSATATLTVKAAVLTVAPKDASRAYGDPNPAIDFTISGLENGEKLADVASGAPSCGSPATAASPVGTYTIACTAGDLAAANYSVDTSGTATLTVTRAVLTVTPRDRSRSYGDPNPPFPAGIGGLKNGERLADVVSGAPSCTSAATAASPVGPYAITCKPGDLKADDYTFDTSATATLTVTPAVLTVTPRDASRQYGTPNPTFTAAISGFQNGEGIDVVSGAPACTSGAGPGSQVGTYRIGCDAGTLKARNYTFDTSPTGTLTVTPATLSVTAAAMSRQYSDPNPAFVGVITGFRNGEALGSSDVTGAPDCTSTATPASPPGTYPITCTAGTLKSTDYAFTVGGGTLTVVPEDARATYTGALDASTSSATSGTATVTLAATVRDISAVDDRDASPGDIRRATITFVNRDANDAVLCTGPIGLVNPVDTTVGTATCNWTANIGSADSAHYTVGMIVKGWYARDASEEDAVVTVSRPLNDFISGGGYLVNERSSGLKAGAQGARTNFGFHLKYNKKNTNLQGSVNVIVRNGGRVYQIKSNALASLSVKAVSSPSAQQPATAVFDGKANIQDITDPDHPVSVDGNAALQITLTDRGEPGTNDTIAITLFDKSGGMWFSSNWNGARTIEQALGGGNVTAR